MSETRHIKTRVVVLGGVFVVTFLVLLIRLFTLQVVNRLVYQERAQAVASRSVEIAAERGRIFDRNQIGPLATNVDSFAVNIVPGEIEHDSVDGEIDRISAFLGVEAAEVKERIKPRYYRNYQPFEVQAGVPKEKIYYLAEHIQDYPGVGWQSKPGRQYLVGGSMPHILGYVDNITAEEYQLLYNQGYTLSAVVGKSGVEKRYDQVLRGESGVRFETVDVKGQQTSGVSRLVPPESGRDIVLTIDMKIQRLAERALGKRKGSVIVLKPSSGEILALVSYPSFDPSVFALGGSKDDYRELALDPESPFLNRAVQSAYPPASVFKLILTTAILEENLVDPSMVVNCTGPITVGDRIFRCWRRTGHGPVDLKMALAQSCDVYFWTVGLEHVGVERILRYAEMYGLGRLAGIDLPGEIKGFMPSPQWKEQRLHAPWVGGDTLNLAIGQGWALVTPLQIANMVAMIVNGGTIYRPHILKEVRDSKTGKVVQTMEPEVLRTVRIKSETFRDVREAMRAVVTDGTARYVLTTEAVQAAGKTGTGEVGLEDDFHSWFVAYAPYDSENPDDQIVVVVMVEAGTEGYEWWSPKAGNAILQGIFANQDYQTAADTLGIWYLQDNEAPW